LLITIIAANILVVMANSSAAQPARQDSDGDVPTAPKSPEKSQSESDSGSTASSENEEDEEYKSDDLAQADGTLWNATIPRPSRTVPVGNIVPRRPGRGRQVFSTPATGRVGRQQQAFRMWAMRHLLGEPVGIRGETISLELVASRWDLGTALRRMNDRLNEARHRHQTNAPNRNAEEQEDDRLLGADSPHHNRQLGINLLYTRLVGDVRVRADQRHPPTTLTLGQLLADHDFDINEAAAAFRDHLLNPVELEHHRRMERRLRLVNPNQLHTDQRIARFMEIAGTDDSYAARSLLETPGHDMLRAMDHWMRNGLARQPIPPSELNRSLFRAPRRLTPILKISGHIHAPLPADSMMLTKMILPMPI
jgi:hypothetical protein